MAWRGAAFRQQNVAASWRTGVFWFSGENIFAVAAWRKRMLAPPKTSGWQRNGNKTYRPAAVAADIACRYIAWQTWHVKRHVGSGSPGEAKNIMAAVAAAGWLYLGERLVLQAQHGERSDAHARQLAAAAWHARKRNSPSRQLAAGAP